MAGCSAADLTTRHLTKRCPSLASSARSTSPMSTGRSRRHCRRAGPSPSPKWRFPVVPGSPISRTPKATSSASTKPTRTRGRKPMPTSILMPALSPTMEEGKLAKWLKKEGDTVKAGDVIAEIETDKATMEVEAVDEGTVARILVPEGTENVKVNTPIALLAGEDEAAGADQASAPAPLPKHNG